MGDMWRSQKMSLVQMIVQNDAAHAVVNKLGTVGIVEFRDLNAGTSFYKRSFVEEVRKCDELARVLRTIAEEYENSEIEIAEKNDKLCVSLSLDDVEPKIKEVDEELSGLKSMQDQLLKNHNALQEQRLVLELGKKIYGARQTNGGGGVPPPVSPITSDEPRRGGPSPPLRGGETCARGRMGLFSAGCCVSSG